MAFPGDYTRLAKLSTVLSEIGTGTHTDYPSLLTELSLGAVKSFIFSNTDDGGGDVRFSTDQAGSNQVSLELESWDTTAETCIGWIKRTVNSSAIVDVYIWGDNTGDSQPAVGAAFGRNSVWVNYEYVSHDGVTDSTGNNTIAQTGSPGVGTNSWGSDSVTLNGTTQFGRVSLTLSVTEPKYYSSWYNTSDVTLSEQSIIGAYDSSVGNKFDNIRILGSGEVLTVWRRNNNSSSTAAVQTTSSTQDVWEKASGYINSSGDRFSYINEAKKVINSTSITQPTGNFDRVSYGMSDDSTPGGFFEGELSEIRVAEFEPDDGFELTEFNNQSDPASFWTIESAGVSMDADSGIYTLSGSDLLLTAQRLIQANAGINVLTGQDAVLIAQASIQADSGAYSLTGDIVSLIASYSIKSDSGTYELIGSDIDFIGSFSTSANSGVYSLVGEIANLIAQRKVIAENGVYLLTGDDVSLFTDYVIIAGSGTYSLTGASVQLDFSGDVSQVIIKVTAEFKPIDVFVDYSTSNKVSYKIAGAVKFKEE